MVGGLVCQTQYLVLRKLKSRPWESKGLRGECEYERVGLLRDFRGELEKQSDERDIERGAVVKII
jgi:hypothetical protein